jgi:hypothetical protein
MTRQIALSGLVLVIAMAGCSGGSVVPVSGTCDENGRYRLTTFRPGDGAPPGDYDVTVHHPAPEDSSQAQTNTLFHVRYENPDTSGLQYTVVRGHNKIDIVLDGP